MKYLVWSIEHKAWRKPGAAGYTKNRSEAARVTLEKAIEWVYSGSYLGDEPEEAIVPEN